MRIFGVTYMTIFGIAVYLKSANAIDCYKCGALENKCKDPFDKNAGVSTISCSGGCFKVKGESSGVQAIERGCGATSENKCEENTLSGVKILTCTCNSNLCNGVIPVRGSFIALVASIGILLIFL